MCRVTYSLLILLSVALIANAQDKLLCDYCGWTIEDEYFNFDGKSFHKHCYRDHIQPRCAHCGEVIDGTYSIVGDKNYHPTCFRENILAKCDICSEPLEGSFLTDYWGNSYHPNHNQQLHTCGTCGRLISNKLTGGGQMAASGLYLCNICSRWAVSEDYLLDSYQVTVRRLLEMKGIEGIPENIPISLVDDQTIKQLSKMPSQDLFGFTDLKANTINGRVVSRESHIYILSHLPLPLFKATLAHELLHVFLFQHDLVLPADIREGFCNLGSELIYSRDDSEFSRFRLENMQKDPDPNYGVGYRKMSQRLQDVGWSTILSELPDL